MNKSLNQRIFEEVLEPMFPGQYLLGDCKYSGEVVVGSEYGHDRLITDGKQFKRFLDDAFWLAEKVGLFEYRLLTFNPSTKEWDILREAEEDDYYQNTIVASAKTIPEAICLAILEIYGRKE